jgi:AcrR family transcriptional regulator
MSPSRPAVVDGPQRSQHPPRTEYRAAPIRVVSAALGLLAERGVSGTSLQMIARRLFDLPDPR